MAVLAENIKTPKGRIPPELFPELKGQAFDDQLTSWIDDAELLTVGIADVAKRDKATVQWVYYRAFDSAYTKALATPISQSTEDAGSFSFNMQQIERLKELRDNAYDAYFVLNPTVTAVVATPRTGGAVKTVITW